MIDLTYTEARNIESKLQEVKKVKNQRANKVAADLRTSYQNISGVNFNLIASNRRQNSVRDLSREQNAVKEKASQGEWSAIKALRRWKSCKVSFVYDECEVKDDHIFIRAAFYEKWITTMPDSIQGVEQYVNSLSSVEELANVISDIKNSRLARVQVFAIKLFSYQWGIKAPSKVPSLVLSKDLSEPTKRCFIDNLIQCQKSQPARQYVGYIPRIQLPTEEQRSERGPHSKPAEQFTEYRSCIQSQTDEQHSERGPHSQTVRQEQSGEHGSYSQQTGQSMEHRALSERADGQSSERGLHSRPTDKQHSEGDPHRHIVDKQYIEHKLNKHNKALNKLQLVQMENHSWKNYYEQYMAGAEQPSLSGFKQYCSTKKGGALTKIEDGTVRSTWSRAQRIYTPRSSQTSSNMGFVLTSASGEKISIWNERRKNFALTQAARPLEELEEEVKGEYSLQRQRSDQVQEVGQLEQERLQEGQSERERLYQQEQSEREWLQQQEQSKRERLQSKQERLQQQEQPKQDRLQQEQPKQDRLQQEQPKQDRLQQEQPEQDRLQQEQPEQDRLQQEQQQRALCNGDSGSSCSALSYQSSPLNAEQCIVTVLGRVQRSLNQDDEELRALDNAKHAYDSAFEAFKESLCRKKALQKATEKLEKYFALDLKQKMEDMHSKQEKLQQLQSKSNQK